MEEPNIIFQNEQNFTLSRIMRSPIDTWTTYYFETFQSCMFLLFFPSRPCTWTFQSEVILSPVKCHLKQLTIVSLPTVMWVYPIPLGIGGCLLSVAGCLTRSMLSECETKSILRPKSKSVIAHNAMHFCGHTWEGQAGSALFCHRLIHAAYKNTCFLVH